MFANVLCRYKGFHEYAKSAGLDVGSPVGLDVIIDGTVPTGKKTVQVTVNGFTSSKKIKFLLCFTLISFVPIQGLGYQAPQLLFALLQLR